MWPEAFLLPFDEFSGPLSVPVLLLLYSLYPMKKKKKKCYNVL